MSPSLPDICLSFIVMSAPFISRLSVSLLYLFTALLYMRTPGFGREIHSKQVPVVKQKLFFYVSLFIIGNTRVQISRRLHALKGLLKRQQEEIANCNSRRNELTKTLKDKEALLASQKEISMIGEEAIESMTQERDLVEEERSVVEERVQEREAMFRAQEKELIDIKSAQGTKDKGPQKGSRAERRKTVFESVLDKQKPSRNVQTHSKCYEEKQETLKTTKEALDAMRMQLEQKTVPVRQFDKAILLKTKELVDIDHFILETMEDIRKVRQKLRWNELNFTDIRRATEETHEELTRTKEAGVKNDAFKIPLWRLEGPENLKSKVGFKA